MLCRTHFRHPKPHVRPSINAQTSYTPAAIAGLYHYPQALPVVAPMSIGIVELGGGFSSADIAAAFNAWGMPVPVVNNHSIQGVGNSPGGDADVEVLLDIQVAAGIYTAITGKAATINMYWCPNTDSAFGAGVRQSYVDKNACTSISWGQDEDGWGAAAIANFDAICKASVDAGTTVMAASGDNLSSDGGQGNNVDYPAASPWVVGCGGTSLQSTEVVWNSDGGGTGGGYSKYAALPAWQVGAPASGGGRLVPDISGLADPETGWKIMVNGGWQIIGGTSAVAPMYAGYFAAIAAGLGKRLGFILPTLYQNPAKCLDVVSGNNGFFRARPGIDECTGIGRVIGNTMAGVFIPTSNPPTPPVPPNPPTPPSPPTPGQPQTMTRLFQLAGTAGKSQIEVEVDYVGTVSAVKLV